LTINQLSLSENALKLTYGNVEFQKFPGEDPRTLRPKGGKGRAGRVEEGRRVGRWRGWGFRKGRGRREGLKEREVEERGEKEEGKGRGFRTPDVPDRSTPLNLIYR
jgi:hypothetical protein